jgi:hypothetical protein
MAKTALPSNAVHCCPLVTVFIGTSNVQHDGNTVKHYIEIGLLRLLQLIKITFFDVTLSTFRRL